MRVLRPGDRGAAVRRWQQFLLGLGFDPGPADGIFGPRTAAATRAFQRTHGLAPDAIAGDRTLGRAMTLGFVLADARDWHGEDGPNWPPPPGFAPLTSARARQRVFGAFEYVHDPAPRNPDRVRVLGDWARVNIRRVRVPQLAGIPGAPHDGRVYLHRLAVKPVRALFARWEALDLLGRVRTWDGGYVPRFVRGSRTRLSNHAFGTAFDINAAWNRLGARPALKGRTGSVRELVAAANALGFYWGGHFGTRPDGMHFELAEVREDCGGA